MPINEVPLLIMIATYNEIESLPRLVARLTEQLPEADLLVIDDASPDGTGDWCEQARQGCPRLQVMHRVGRRGLGSATRDGFQWALDRDYALIATMDADLSHDPDSLVQMVSRMNSDAEKSCGVMIGSRYIPGGGTAGWPWRRRMASRLVNGFSRLRLGLTTRDNSGAFRVYRREALGDGLLNELQSSDFAYLEEILWRLKRRGVSFCEHPIVFRDRTRGRSKTSIGLGVRVLWKIATLR